MEFLMMIGVVALIGGSLLYVAYKEANDKKN